MPLATAYGLNAAALGRLGEIGRRHPDVTRILGAKVIDHLEAMPPGHPARAALVSPGARQRYERLGVRLLSGRLDDEVVERLRVRMNEPMADGTPSTMVFVYSTVIPPALFRELEVRHYPLPVCQELANTMSRLVMIFVVVSSDMFTRFQMEQVQDLQGLHAVASELGTLAGSLEAMAYADGDGSLEGRVQAALSALGDVAAHAADIGGIVELIRSIASQTNLLALNATIEAARAGQEGKGFAVVASEVKNLAHSTHQSLGRIEELVSVMQGSVDRASSSVSGVETSSGELRATAEAMARISQSLA